MSVTIFKDGVRVGECDLPQEIADKANDVRVWMMVNGIEHLCGLTQSLDAHLKIGALDHEIEQLKAQLRKGERLLACDISPGDILFLGGRRVVVAECYQAHFGYEIWYSKIRDEDIEGLPRLEFYIAADDEYLQKEG